MKKGSLSSWGGSVLIFLFILFLAACGGGYGGGNGGGGGGGGGGNAPIAPTGLTATAGSGKVDLSWSASSGATSYHVKRSTTSGGPYTQVAAPTATTYPDTSVNAGTAYYYVVSALNAYGESANSLEKSATPTASSVAVNVTVDVLRNRHTISPYVYGGAFPADANTISNTGLTVVRWGGNGASTYNWKLGTTNADNDYFYEDFTFCGMGGFATGTTCTDSDSVQWIKDVKAAGGLPLMSMVMLPWVAQSPEQSLQQGNGSNNYHWTFSVSQDNACSQAGKVDQFNTDAATALKSDCSTPFTATAAQVNRVYFPLLDQPGVSDPPNSVYRSQWAAALATAFGNNTPHFYDMDNEIDIWGGTHFDVHPNPSGYDELRDTYIVEARLLKTWDPAAIRLGPVSCCWWFYWNGENGNDKAAHGNVDFLPWWLNEVYWRDQIDNKQSLDVFDIHAYPATPDISSNLWSSPPTLAQKQAASIRVFRDWWDPSYSSEATAVNQPWATSIQPQRTISFTIPRMRALFNTIYPLANKKLAITEWSTGFADNSGATPPVFDFSTAISDALGYGILGQQGVYLASRWTAPDPRGPGFKALQLYRNYDGGHNTFGDLSVHASHNADPSLFGAYAAVNTASGKLTIMVVNGDPVNAAQVQLTLSHFTPSTFTAYTLSKANPTIAVSASQGWNSSQTFAPYSITLLVVSGAPTATPASEWELNPAEIMVPANGTITISPQLTSGTTSVSMTAANFDAFAGSSACSGAITLTNPTIASGTPGTITFLAGSQPAFCHYTVTASDNTAKGGWLIVGNPAATLTNNSPASGTAGTQVTLSVTLDPGSSIGGPVCQSPCGPASAGGSSVLFTVDAGTLSGGAYGNAANPLKQIATVDNAGNATVKLTLPNPAGTMVHVTAEGAYGLGHPVATFTVTSN